MLGNIRVKCRPLRLAFFIQPNQRALRKVIQINSTLWGGTFNPIIPLYGRAPKSWKQYPRQRISTKGRVLGYIRAFDPDILVNCGGHDLPSYLRDLARPIIKVDEIWADFQTDSPKRTPKYGIGIFELLDAIYKEYFEVRRRFPYTVAFPKIPRHFGLFWSATVGEISPAFETIVDAKYSEAIDIEKPTLDAATYGSILDGKLLFPRRVVQHGLSSEGPNIHRHDVYGFYMDAESVQDIVDYWNLRALGRSVLPIPKQFVDVPQFLELIRTFIKANYRVSRHNPAITYGTSIVRSFSSKMSELENLVKVLEPVKLLPEGATGHSVSLQHWYPRIWDEWAIGRDGAIPDLISSAEKEFSFPNTDGDLTFNLVPPDFQVDIAMDAPRYANEIYPRFYGRGEHILADVLPYDHGAEVLRVAGGRFALRNEFRIGRTGLIHLIGWETGAHWKVPSAEEIFIAWLKDKGFEAELSSCGRLAKQVHTQLAGWLAVLTNEQVLKLFETMNKGGEDGKGMDLGAVKNTLRQINRPGNLYRSLVERNVFKLGYRTQCPHCQRRSWYSLSMLASELVCPLCHRTISAINAVDSENKGAWYLKAAGPFSVSNYADGSYCVLLSLNFLEQDRTFQTTPIVSFTTKQTSTGKTFEADFGLIWQETVFGETQDGVLFAECKSYNRFEKAKGDFERMRNLAKQFPGAILAFCTLRKELEPSEIRELKRITAEGMRYWKAERPINPVLILTGRELFGFARPPYCWTDISVPDWAKRAHTLLELCNATQAIYLGAPHWGETWHKEFERRRNRKKRRP